MTKKPGTLFLLYTLSTQGGAHPQKQFLWYCNFFCQCHQLFHISNHYNNELCKISTRFHKYFGLIVICLRIDLSQEKETNDRCTRSFQGHICNTQGMYVIGTSDPASLDNLCNTIILETKSHFMMNKRRLIKKQENLS